MDDVESNSRQRWYFAISLAKPYGSASVLGAAFMAGAALFFGQVGGLAKTSRGVQSIEISGLILAAMADAATPLLLKDLAGAIQLPPGQIHPYLVSLRKLGLVEQSLHSGRYQLGPAALRLALAYVQSRHSVSSLWEALPDLATEMGAGMTMSLCCRFGPIILRTAEVPDQPFTNLRAGSLYSVTTTATGRLFAAFKDEAVVAAIYERQRPNHESKQPASELHTAPYKSIIETIRREGVSWTTGHPAPGISALSAPIFDGGEIVAAITAIAPSEKLDVSKDSEQRQRLMEIASRYSVGTAVSQGNRAPQ
jgi:DNA-binding IclR family transcriptional regulator